MEHWILQISPMQKPLNETIAEFHWEEITYLKTAQILMLALTLLPAHFYAVAHLLPLTYW